MSAVVRQLRSQKKSVRVGVVTILSLVGLLVFAITAQHGLPDYVPGVHRTSVDATFGNVGALTAGSDVRIADVRVGYVKSIHLRNGLPVAQMSLDGSQQVYGNATAIIRAQSGLGEKYIDLDPGTSTGGAITPQGIPEVRTQDATDLNDVLNTFDAKTRAATKRILSAVGGGLDGRGQDLSSGLQALPTDLEAVGSISSALSANHGTDLAALLRAANDLSNNLQGQETALAALTRGTGVTLGAIGTRQGAPLGQVLRNAPTGLSALHSAMTSLQEPLAALSGAAQALAPGARKLAAATPDLRAFLRSSVPVLHEVPGFANLAVPALTKLTPAATKIQPLVRQVGSAIGYALGPLAYLGAYRADALSFFERAENALRMGDAAGHWLRVYVVAGTELVSGNLPMRSPLISRQAYPAPGTADSHNTNR